MRVNYRNITFLTLLGILVVASGCEDAVTCYVPYEPAGPAASTHCDCPNGTLYLCANEDTCSGEVGRTSCEDQVLAATLNQRQRCDECQIDFTTAGAVFVECE